MEPITAGLLVALGAAIKEKAVGAAAERLLAGAKHQAAKLRALLPDRSEEELAKEAVAYVLAESVAYPPSKAIMVVPLATNRDRSGGSVGIWPPDGRLAIELAWINRADFPIWIRDVAITGRLGGPAQAHEYEHVRGDEFVLAPRGQASTVIEAQLRKDIASPRFEREGASVDLTVGALVSGPWEGESQKTRELFRGGLWIPVFVDPSDVLTDEQDIRIALDQWFSTHFNPTLMGAIKPVLVKLADVDRECKVLNGSSKRYLASIARSRSYEVVEGSATIQIKWTERAAEVAQRPPPLFRR